MKIDDFKIRLGQGIDRITFGMSRTEVKKLLGKPNEITEKEFSDHSKVEIYHYHDLELAFTFNSEDNYHLTNILVYGDDFHLADRLRIGLRLEELLEVIKEFNWEDPHIEDASTPENPNQKRYVFDELNLSVWLDEHVVSAIEFGLEKAGAQRVVWGEYL